MYKTGDRIRLKWCGDAAVPKFLNYSWATISEITPKGNLKVIPDIEARLRTVNPNKHVIKELSK